MQTICSILTCTILLMSFVVLCNIIYEMIKAKLSKKKNDKSSIATLHKYNKGKNFCPFSINNEEDLFYRSCENCRCSIKFESNDGKEIFGYACGLVYKFKD